MDNFFHKDSTLNDKIEALEFLNNLLSTHIASDPRNAEKKVRVEKMIKAFKTEKEAKAAEKRKGEKPHRQKSRVYCSTGL